MKNKSLTREQSREILAKLSPADFQGKTDFASLSPEKKLERLSHAAMFVMQARSSTQNKK